MVESLKNLSLKKTYPKWNFWQEKVHVRRFHEKDFLWKKVGEAISGGRKVEVSALYIR